MKKEVEDRIVLPSDAISESAVIEVSRFSNEDFGREANRNRPRIFRFLLSSLRDRDLAEVLTQECLLKAYRSWHRFRGDSQVSTWLMRIAINLQRDYWRSRRMEFWRQTRTNSLWMWMRSCVTFQLVTSHQKGLL